MREENGEDTANARIKIDYSKKKPKVTFSYPSKDNQVHGSMFVYIFMFWFIVIGTPLMTYVSFHDMNNKETIFPENFNSSKYNLSNYGSYLEFVNDSGALRTAFNKINSIEKQRFWERDDSKDIIILYGIILLTVMFSILTYFPYRKQWKRVYPKFQALLARKKLTTLKHKDINFSEKENKYYCELPVFENIILDYTATEDFSKYLCLFEIKEHNFKYYNLGRGRIKINKKMSERRKKRLKKEKKKKELNEWIWYARFYFNKEPKKGKINIIYK